jgi:hypothetical protein
MHAATVDALVDVVERSLARTRAIDAAPSVADAAA